MLLAKSFRNGFKNNFLSSYQIFIKKKEKKAYISYTSSISHLPNSLSPYCFVSKALGREVSGTLWTPTDSLKVFMWLKSRGRFLRILSSVSFSLISHKLSEPFIKGQLCRESRAGEGRVALCLSSLTLVSLNETQACFLHNPCLG